MEERPPIRAGRWIAEGIRSLALPPFRTLIAISVLVSLATTSFRPDDDAAPQFALALGLLAIQVYVQIALILAAGSGIRTGSADEWLKAAWRRRCFWRLILASIVTAVAVLAGAALLVIGAFVAGAIVGLAQPAAVLERLGPVRAAGRSITLTRGSRRGVGIVFGVLVLVPLIALQAGSILGLPDELGAAWVAISLVAQLANAAGYIALTRIFVELGGTATPPLDAMAPDARARIR